jgi:hypothetical protein
MPATMPTALEISVVAHLAKGSPRHLALAVKQAAARPRD